MRRKIEPRANQDTHTEHCCRQHGCKYPYGTCSVEDDGKLQSGFCQECYGYEFDNDPYGQWSSRWPTKEGSFWFYGLRNEKDKEPATYLVRVRPNIQGKLYVESEGGLFLFQDQGAEGMWRRAELPELPAITLMFRSKEPGPCTDPAGHHFTKETDYAPSVCDQCGVFEFEERT